MQKGQNRLKWICPYDIRNHKLFKIILSFALLQIAYKKTHLKASIMADIIKAVAHVKNIKSITKSFIICPSYNIYKFMFVKMVAKIMRNQFILYFPQHIIYSRRYSAKSCPFPTFHFMGSKFQAPVTNSLSVFINYNKQQKATR